MGRIPQPPELTSRQAIRQFIEAEAIDILHERVM